ncbi:MAG: hypothetical protein WCJ54_02680 [Actinomycetota bacterium]
MKLYKLFSIATAAIFAVVGLIFLIFPDWPLIFFNNISDFFRLPQVPLPGTGFYLILASAYMYLVALLAILMYRNPKQSIYPFLLAQGKLASSVLSIYLFFMHQHYLIYLANFVIDGFIGVMALLLMKKMKKTGV